MPKHLDCLTDNARRREPAGARKFVANRNVRLEGRSWVYFVQRGRDGPIKIGRSRQLTERLCALQSTCPEDLILLGKIPETDVSETVILDAFHRHRIRGEWFHPVPDILELAEAGQRIYAAGYCREIPDALTDQWLTIAKYTVRPREIGPPSPFDLVSEQLEKAMEGQAEQNGAARHSRARWRHNFGHTYPW